jgi:hypothetical protein
MGTDGRARVLHGSSVSPTALTLITFDGLVAQSSSSLTTFTPGSLALTLDGHDEAHVVFRDEGYDLAGSGAGLKYAHFDGTQWTQEIITAPARHATMFTSIAVRPDGAPWVSYADTPWPEYSDDKPALRVASRGASGWTNSVVEQLSEGQVLSTSLAVDGGGQIAVSYVLQHADLSTELRYAVYSDGWHLETIPNLSDATAVSLALDEASQPHMAVSRRSAELDYVSRSDAGWSIDPILGHVVGSPALTLDAQQRPHVSLSDLNDGWVKYAHTADAPPTR